MAFDPQDKINLTQYFLPDEHEVRVLYTAGKDVDHNWKSGKVKEWAIWSVYIKRDAIINRLNKYFFGEWESGFLNPEQPCLYHAKHVDCAMHLTVRGTRMEYNGSQLGTGEHAAKGAATDAFKRVASQWGMGIYLQHPPTLMTKNPETVNKDAGKDFESDILKTVGNWVLGLSANAKPGPTSPPPKMSKTMPDSSEAKKLPPITIPYEQLENRRNKVFEAVKPHFDENFGTYMKFCGHYSVDWNMKSDEIIQHIRKAIQ